jgi:hypothetical protein
VTQGIDPEFKPLYSKKKKKRKSKLGMNFQKKLFVLLKLGMKSRSQKGIAGQICLHKNGK